MNGETLYRMAYNNHRYKPENSLREQIVGDWRVVLSPCGYGRAIYIYNIATGQEHYKYPTLMMPWEHLEDGEVKDFYKKWESDSFSSVVELAKKWA